MKVRYSSLLVTSAVAIVFLQQKAANTDKYAVNHEYDNNTFDKWLDKVSLAFSFPFNGNGPCLSDMHIGPYTNQPAY